MSRTAWALLSLATLFVPCTAVSESVQFGANPMRKIITMLQDMQKEIEREGEMEKEIFEKAMCACETGQKELQKTIEDATSESEEQSSAIEAQTSEQATLKQEIEDHKTSKAQAEKDLAEATAIRDKAHKAFVKEEKDNKHSIAGLDKAIPAIEKGMGASSLMQTRTGRRLRRTIEVTHYLSSDERTGVLAFLDAGSSDEDQVDNSVQAPGTGEILGIMKNMKDEMSKDLGEMQAQEKADFESFNELKAAKSQEIAVNAKAVISKEKRVGALALSLSEAKHSLEDAEEELANGQKMLASMKEECDTKKKEQLTKAKTRHEENAAIGDAIKILNDDDALEVFSKAKSFVQQPRIQQTYDAFLQVSTKLRIKHAHRGAANHQQEQKEEPGGEAEKLVGTMIEGMVAVLHDEDVGDEHKKAWCANETTTNEALEAEKKTLIEKTDATITEAEDTIATLAEEIKGLTTKIQALDKMVHDATEQRKSEHQEFVDAFATSSTAIRLVNKAIKRLEKFYSPEKAAAERKAASDAALAKAGLALNQRRAARRQDARAAAVAKLENSLMPGGLDDFVQVKARMRIKQPQIPSTPSSLFQKQESGGVIGLMNDFITDLKMDMTESETEEKFNAKDYVRIMTEAQETRQADVKALNEKKKEKATADTKLLEDKELLEATKDEHHNLELYLAQLHGECDFLMRNFEVRHEGRIDEEVGLEDAKTIVTHEEPPNHREVEQQFDDEKTAQDVDEHFPGTAISDIP